MGSWPGTDPRRVNGLVRDLLAENGLPYLAELPDRGPGADLIGRTAALLPDLSVDLQPSGWRLSGGRGRDAARGAAYLRQDLDELAEAYDGYAGELKLSLCGPWTLAASVALPRGEKALSDPGACRDLRQALLAAATEHVDKVSSLIPGADIVLQFDEPSLTGVLAGSVPTASGFSRLRSVDEQTAREALTELTAGLAPRVRSVVVHTCAPSPPLRMLADVPDLAVAVDVALLGGAEWDLVAEAVEASRPPWLGVVPTDATGTHPGRYVERVLAMWRRLGLPDAGLSTLTLSPACGLAGRSPDAALGVARLVQAAAHELGEIAQGS
nr:methionine synthase [Allobranchiibius sp. CTAmp26]